MKSLIKILMLICLLKLTVSGQNNISRQQVILNAEPFETHIWTCDSINIWNNQNCGGKNIKTPFWVTVGNHTGLPYCWGGNSSLNAFDSLLLLGRSAGDQATNYGYGAEPNCTGGVDCSGFVSRCYGLDIHYATSMLNINQLFGHYNYWNQLRYADFVNKPGSHTRLIHKVNPNGSYDMIESGSGVGNVGFPGLYRVFYDTYNLSDLTDYNPQYYVYTDSLKLLDCSAPINLQCGIPYSRAASNDSSFVYSYGCNNWTETGPERIHEFVATDSNGFEVTISNFTGDLDVYILQSCNPHDCIGTVSSSSAILNNSIPGTKYFIAVDSDDGSGSSYDIIVDCLPPLGLVENVIPSAKIYPNPTNDFFQIDLEENQANLLMFDMVGKQVLNEMLLSQSTQISVEHLKPGIYLIKIIQGSSVFTEKLNIQ
ncbi:MAG: T9SS type A sorting domain-containing protein [Flavobacteriales bacterium]|nr:T9SS type A sorting domain-containing protein [Flavobacteriales bacterium]